MKSRIPKQNKDEKIEVSKNSKDFVIELGKPITQIDEKVKKQYEIMINHYGEGKKLDIIEYMKTSDFINNFSPCTPPIKKRISESVSKLGEEVVYNHLENTVDRIRKNHKFSLETIIEKMKSNKFKEQLKKLVPKSLSSITDKATNKFIKKVSKELEDSKTKTSEIKNPTDLSIEDEQFFERVKDFTNGFDFLAKDLVVYTSETGKNNSKKFKNYDDYIKFAKLQEKVRQTMGFLKTDENTAINTLLKDGRLEKIDFNILKARKNELDKNKKEERLPSDNEI